MPTTPTINAYFRDHTFRYISGSVMWGLADPGTTVQLWNGGILLASMTTHPDGLWDTPLDFVLADGTYHVTAVSIDAAGNKSNASASLDFISDTMAPAAPTIVLEKTGAADFLATLFSGTAEANATVELNFGQAGSLTTMADAKGHWLAAHLLPDGHNLVTVVASDGAGNKSPATTLSFDRTTPPDDVGNDAAHAATLPVDSSVSRAIDFLDDTDWFKLSLSELTAYTISLKGARTGGGTIDVNKSSALLMWDPAANGGAGEYTFLTGLTSGDADLVITLPVTHSGDYYLSYSASNQVGTYTLGLATLSHDDYYNDEARAGAVLPGATIAGRFDYRDDTDVFRVHLTAGTTYLLDLAPGADLSIFAPLSLLVTDAAHSLRMLSRTDDQHHAGLSFVPAVTGDYFVSAIDNGLFVGSYQLSIRQDTSDDFGASPANSGRLAIGASVQGTTEVSGDRDWFAVNLQAGTAYTFQLDHGSNGHSSSLSMRDASGALLFLNTVQYDQGSLLTWTPAASGTYFLDVGNYAGKAGYILQARLADTDDHGASSASAGLINFGQATSGRLETPHDVDWYKVSVKANAAYTFQLQPLKEGMGSVPQIGSLSVVNGIGQVLASGMPHGTTTQVTWQATADGDYYVAVSAYNEIFSYSISAAVNDQDRYLGSAGTTGTLGPGGVIRSSIDFGGDTDWFKVELQAGQQYSFELTGTKQNGGTLAMPELKLYGSSTSPLLVADGSATADPFATFTPTTSGTYYLEARAYPQDNSNGNGTGTYTLKAGSASAPIVVFNFVGGPDADVYLNTAKADAVDGGAGLDTVIYTADSGSYSIHVIGQAIQVSGPALDTLLDVERVVFNDRAIAFDLDGTAGDAYRLYQASFNRKPDVAGLGYWIAQMDKGMSLHDVAQNFIASDEFKTLFGAAPSDEDFVKALYGNVLHRLPDQGGHDYWIGALHGGLSRADVLVDFSISAENQAAVIGQISQGIGYVPWH